MPFLSGATVEDPRPELKKLRRGTLKQICRDNGLEFDESNHGADSLRRIIASNSIDVRPYLEQAHVLGERESATKAIKRVEQEKDELKAKVEQLTEQVMKLMEAHATSQEKIAEKDEMPESFEGLPIWRLRQLCKASGIKTLPTDKTEDLVRKLNEYVTERR